MRMAAIMSSIAVGARNQPIDAIDSGSDGDKHGDDDSHYAPQTARDEKRQAYEEHPAHHPHHRRRRGHPVVPRVQVLAVILRVAGPVITKVRAHAAGVPERQVCTRLGDALLYLTDPKVAARTRQHWDWLAHVPDTYPVGVSLRPTGDITLDTKGIAARRETRTPAHPRIQVDRAVWQVCDRQAWNAIGDALFEAQTYLEL